MSDRHIHLYVGPDEFAARQLAEKFLSDFTDATTADMNISRFDARTVGENELSNAVGVMPFLAGKRLVQLEYVSKRFNGLDGHKKFLAFLDTVPPFTRLVVIDPEEIKDKVLSNHWMGKWAAKNADKAEFKACLLPKRAEMPGWIVKETKNQGGVIDFPAAARLAEMVGENTRQAAQEITKLLTYVNYAHSIAIEDVESVSIVTASVNVFDLVDALGNRDGKTAQKLLHRFLEEKSVFEVFGLVVRQFRLMIQARDLIDAGGIEKEAEKELGVHEFVAGKAYNQAKNFTMDDLRAIYHRLLAMDEASKSGGMPLEASLDILIVELTARVQ